MKKQRANMMSCILWLVAIWISYPTSTLAIETNSQGEVIETLGTGTINWTTRRLEASGVADPDQPVYSRVRAAQIAARAELLTIIKGLRIRGQYGIIQGVLRKDISEVDLEGFLGNSYVTEPVINNLGLVEAKAFVFLDRQGNSVLLPDKGMLKTEGVRSPPSASKPLPSRYSGLIIDARGLGLKPALAPRILGGPNHLEVYGGAAVDKEYALNKGLMGYTASMEKARALNERIGATPLEIKAVAAVDGTDAEISLDDALIISSALKAYDFLKECRVVMVLN